MRTRPPSAKPAPKMGSGQAAQQADYPSQFYKFSLNSSMRNRWAQCQVRTQIRWRVGIPASRFPLNSSMRTRRPSARCTLKSGVGQAAQQAISPSQFCRFSFNSSVRPCEAQCQAYTRIGCDVSSPASRFSLHSSMRARWPSARPALKLCRVQALQHADSRRCGLAAKLDQQELS